MNPLQSGFRPEDSIVNQLVYLVHKVYDAFLDISKAFDKVWHKGLVYKLELLGVRGSPLKWFESYLSNRKQRVVVDGQTSSWCTIEADLPKGFVLGPLLFLIYINYITMNIHSDKSNCLLYEDDTSLFDIVESPNDSADKLNPDLEEMHSWAKTWLVITINPTKTECMTFSAKRTKQQHPDLFYDGKKIHEVSHYTHLGVTLFSNLSWREHILNIYEKASKRLNVLKGIKYQVGRDTLKALYKSLVRPLMEYADVVWNGCSDTESDLLDSVQYEAGKIVTGAMKGTSGQRLMCKLGWEELKTRRAIQKLTLYF